MNNNVKAYNLRVYGILLNQEEELLLSNEVLKGKSFTKFPGGGHELGEGLIDCLKREFKEELNIEIDAVKHFYTTDYFQESAFNAKEQLISVYYLVESAQAGQIRSGSRAVDDENNTFFWEKLADLEVDTFTFPVDQLVLENLKSKPMPSFFDLVG